MGKTPVRFSKPDRSKLKTMFFDPSEIKKAE
jgi:hypothetical protein